MNNRNRNLSILNARIRDARQFDEHVFERMDNPLDDEHYFEKQVHATYLNLARLIKELWQLDKPEINDNSLKNSSIILANTCEELKNKLKRNNEPEENIKDALNALNNILYKQDAQLKDLFKVFKTVIEQQNRQQLIETITYPFKRLASFTRNLVTNLYFHITLNAQLNRGTEFQNIEQSTHLPFVHRSVTKSLNKLDERTPRPEHLTQLQRRHYEKNILREIEDHIKKMELSANQKNYAFETLLMAKDHSAIEPHSKRSIKDTLITVWTAAKDHKAYGPEDSEADVQARLNQIINHLALANREYNMNEDGIDDGARESRPACLGGTVNKIVESLDLIHPDVRIIRGLDIVGDIAQETFDQEFKKLSNEDQITLYNTTGNSEIRDRINAIVNERIDEIKQIFDGVLGAGDQARLDSILKQFEDNLNYLNLPETLVIKNYKAEQEKLKEPFLEASASVENSVQKQSITVNGETITPEQIQDVVTKFNLLKKIPAFKSFKDEMLLQRAIKQAFPEEFWDKNDNLEVLSNVLLAHIKAGHPQQASTIPDRLMHKYKSDLAEIKTDEKPEMTTSFTNGGT